ncbi:MAG: FGGY family carbohydrate kinase [Ruthenibacterium sp.]
MENILIVMLTAQGGRHVLVHRERGVSKARQVYNFRQSILDFDAVLAHIADGVRECIRQGLTPEALALCTQERGGVLLDKQDELLWCAQAAASQQIVDAVHQLVRPQALYYASGMQCRAENILYSLAALRMQDSTVPQRAVHFASVVDYLNYRLTGILRQEYTCAIATGLVDAAQKTWNTDLLCALQLPAKLFSAALCMPGQALGTLRPQLARETGFQGQVFLAPHAAAAVCRVLPKATAVFLCGKDKILLGMRTSLLALSEKGYQDGFSYWDSSEGYLCCCVSDTSAKTSAETLCRLERQAGEKAVAVYAPNARETHETALERLGLPLLTQPREAAALAAALQIMLPTNSSATPCEDFWRTTSAV